MSEEKKAGGPSIGDFAGAGQIINSDVAKSVYRDALSTPVRQIGELTEDTVKACRLFLAPIQLLAAYQDRFKAFCQRVREKVPESEQCDAAPEIARPVMEALASTSDDSLLMRMFEELMAKAIDKREAGLLSPEFPRIIKSLSPHEALLLADLAAGERYTDDVLNASAGEIIQRSNTDFDFARYGGHSHHLTISQRLKDEGLMVMLENQPIPEGTYSVIELDQHLQLSRTVYRLSMFGRWFVSKCVAPRP